MCSERVSHLAKEGFSHHDQSSKPNDIHRDKIASLGVGSGVVSTTLMPEGPAISSDKGTRAGAAGMETAGKLGSESGMDCCENPEKELVPFLANLSSLFLALLYLLLLLKLNLHHWSLSYKTHTQC